MTGYGWGRLTIVYTVWCGRMMILGGWVELEIGIRVV